MSFVVGRKKPTGAKLVKAESVKVVAAKPNAAELKMKAEAHLKEMREMKRKEILSLPENEQLARLLEFGFDDDAKALSEKLAKEEEAKAAEEEVAAPAEEEAAPIEEDVAAPAEVVAAAPVVEEKPIVEKKTARRARKPRKKQED